MDNKWKKKEGTSQGDIWRRIFEREINKTGLKTWAVVEKTAMD